MEHLVVRKMEEMKSRASEWDPDEYTVAYRQQLKRQRQKEKEEKANADANGDETKSNGMKEDEMEANAYGAENS